MKMRMFVFVALATLSMGCLQFEDAGGSSDKNAPTGMEQLNVPAGFTYQTSLLVSTDLTVEDQAGTPAAHRAIRAYAPSADGKIIPGNLFYSGKTDANGKVATPLRIPAHWDHVLVSLRDDGASPTRVPVLNGRIAGKVVAN